MPARARTRRARRRARAGQVGEQVQRAVVDERRRERAPGLAQGERRAASRARSGRGRTRAPRRRRGRRRARTRRGRRQAKTARQRAMTAPLCSASNPGSTCVDCSSRRARCWARRRSRYASAAAAPTPAGKQPGRLGATQQRDVADVVEQLGPIGAVAEDERLHRELDVHHAARAVLDVEAAGLDRMRRAHLLAHRPHFAEQRLQIGGAATRCGAPPRSAAPALDAGHQRAASAPVLPGPRRVCRARSGSSRTTLIDVTSSPELPFGLSAVSMSNSSPAAVRIVSQVMQLADESAVHLGRLVGLGLGSS